MSKSKSKTKSASKPQPELSVPQQSGLYSPEHLAALEAEHNDLYWGYVP